MEKIEGWLLNVFLGKVLTRVAIVIAAYVAGPIVQGLAVKSGITVAVDPSKLQAELMVLAMAAFEWFKKRRMANPASPAVQTDPKLIVPAPSAVVVAPPQD